MTKSIRKSRKNERHRLWYHGEDRDWWISACVKAGVPLCDVLSKERPRVAARWTAARRIAL